MSPAVGEATSLVEIGAGVLCALMKAGFTVIVRPHPPPRPPAADPMSDAAAAPEVTSEIAIALLRPLWRMLQLRPDGYFVAVCSGDAHRAIVDAILADFFLMCNTTGQAEVEAMLLRALVRKGFSVRIVAPATLPPSRRRPPTQ